MNHLRTRVWYTQQLEEAVVKGGDVDSATPIAEPSVKWVTAMLSSREMNVPRKKHLPLNEITQ